MKRKKKQKKKKVIKLNFTPEQMKLIFGVKTPNLNPKRESNTKNSNINTKENN